MARIDAERIRRLVAEQYGVPLEDVAVVAEVERGRAVHLSIRVRMPPEISKVTIATGKHPPRRPPAPQSTDRPPTHEGKA